MRLLSLIDIWTRYRGKWVFHEIWWPPVRLVHRLFFLSSYNDSANVGGMEQKSVPHIRTSDIVYLCMDRYFCHRVHLFERYTMLVLSFQISFFDYQLLTSASFVLFCSVDPSPLTPYPWCHLTRNDPIIFVCWVLFLFYDTGADWHDAKQNILKNMFPQVMLILIAIPAWRACELVSMLIRRQFLRCIFQIARQVDLVSWKLCTEMVSSILFSLSLFLF